MAAMRSGARGFFVLPGFDLGETGSLAAIFFAFAGGTPLIAAARLDGESFWGGGSFFAARGIGESMAAIETRLKLHRARLVW